MKSSRFLGKAKWTEASMARAIVRNLFHNAVLAVPCCGWTGHEADLLVVTKDLRLIDVEIKISRSDLKADLGKDKWWKYRPWSRRHLPAERREWPDKVWKHYYVMPAAVWTSALTADIPATSGVLLADDNGRLEVFRRATPCRDAKPIGAADAVDIARLASLRMWATMVALDAYKTEPAAKTA